MSETFSNKILNFGLFKFVIFKSNFRFKKKLMLKYHISISKNFIKAPPPPKKKNPTIDYMRFYLI